MKIKICGLKYRFNVQALESLQPDYMGFIFYKESKRFIGEEALSWLRDIDKRIQRVGVFVNEPISNILEMSNRYDFDYVQLHGNETLADLKALKEQERSIIRAIPMADSVDWSQLEDYALYTDFLLFDTATEGYGGSGRKFNWDLLKGYQLDIPFFLSGGIGVGDVQEIKNLNIGQLHGIDVNSKMEKTPGLKDIGLLKSFINEIRNEE